MFLVVFTWWALESSGVAVIETKASDGSTRATHVWFAEPDGELCLEAGTPSNPWFVDSQRDPNVAFTSQAHSGRFVVEPIDGPGAHDRIRSLLRSKYGLRDRWIALLFDTSHSVAVRLVPAEKRHTR